MFKRLRPLLPSLPLLFVLAGASPTPAEHEARPQVASTTPGAAQGTCTGALVHVNAPSSSEHEVACSAARRALDFLNRCKIVLQRPLQVRITGDLHHPFGLPVLGFFDVEREEVLIGTREWILPRVSPGVFSALPFADFYASIVVHEIVHGVLHQNAGEYVMSHIAGEYVAYALQIASLPVDVRQLFLDALPARGNPKEFLFSDILLSLDPPLFAARAYDHFKASSDACQYASLLQRELDFIAPAYGYY